MLAVVRDGHGVLALNWSWLPTWIGMNTALVRSIEEELSPQLVGKHLDELTLQFAHNLVMESLQKRFNLPGLHAYLDGLKYLPDAVEGYDEER